MSDPAPRAQAALDNTAASPLEGTGKPAPVQDSGKTRWRPSILTVLTLGLALFLVISLSAVGLVTLTAAQKNTTDLMALYAETTVETIEELLDAHVQGGQAQVDFLAEQMQRQSSESFDPDATASMMTGSLAGVPQVKALATFFRDGRSVRVARDQGGVTYEFTPWHKTPDSPKITEIFSESKKNEPGKRWVTWMEFLQEAGIGVAASFNHADRSTSRPDVFDGVVGAVITIKELSEFVADLSESYGVTTFVLYGRNRVIAHPLLADSNLQISGLSESTPLPEINQVGDPVLPLIWSPKIDDIDILNDSGLTGLVVRNDGQDQIFIYREVFGWSDEPWIIGIHMPGELIALPYKRLIWAASTGLIICILAVIIAMIVGRAIARPAQRLAEASNAIRDMDFQNAPRLKGSWLRELNDASGAYNAMLDGLKLFETYVPRALVTRLLSRGAGAFHSEARNITVLFTDVVGFTSLSEQLSPDETAAFLNEHFALLGECIDAEDGTIDKYIGDSVMAFWGAPTTQEDHAQRACRAALRMSKALSAENKKRAEQGLRPIRLRIGIHSGMAIVGNIGAPGRVNYTLVGDTVNTAQRLEALGNEFLTEDLVVLLSAETAAALPPSFHLSSKGSQQLRGREGATEILMLEKED
ncbi:adenylate/guanylate cyclase domain-containing protein [Rhodovibrionaceae bacterium A322]